MTRKEFFDTLMVASPAIADGSMLTALGNFWFDGKRVHAWNDEIAISVPCPTDFTLGVPGTLLLRFLNASKADTMVIEQTNDDLLIKLGKGGTRIKLPTSDFAEFKSIRQPFKSDPAKKIKVDTGEFLEALETCMPTIGNNSGQIDTMGITLIAAGTTKMFATNINNLIQVELKGQNSKIFKRAVLPREICKQILRLADKKEPLHLEIHDGYALLFADKTHVYSRLLVPEHPLDFEDLIEQHAPGEILKKLVPMPSALKGAVERALVITSRPTDMLHTNITVKTNDAGKRVMQFLSQADGIGEIKDSLSVDIKHPEVKVRVNIFNMRDGYGMKEFLVCSDCVVMKRENVTYVVSVLGE